MTGGGSEEELALLETSLAALATSLRDAALPSAAQALEVLPPAGVEGWASIWIASLGFAREVAKRWGATASEARKHATTRKDYEGLEQLRRDLDAVEQETSVLIEKLVGAFGS